MVFCRLSFSIYKLFADIIFLYSNLDGNNIIVLYCIALKRRHMYPKMKVRLAKSWWRICCICVFNRLGRCRLNCTHVLAGGQTSTSSHTPPLPSPRRDIVLAVIAAHLTPLFTLVVNRTFNHHWIPGSSALIPLPRFRLQPPQAASGRHHLIEAIIKSMY